MIMALLHMVDTISFPVKWQHPDPAAQYFSIRRRQESFAITTSGYQNILQMPGVLHVYGSEMTRSDDVVSKEKVARCHVAPGVEIKPKGCCLNPSVPTEQKTWLFAHLLSITETESQPLTGCDLDRWIARHVLFIAEKVGQQRGTLPPALKS